MSLKEMNKEVIGEMKKYCGNVKRKGIDENRYHMNTHHAYALYDLLKEDVLDAFIVCFDYGFSKGIQAERNRAKNA